MVWNVKSPIYGVKWISRNFCPFKVGRLASADNYFPRQTFEQFDYTQWNKKHETPASPIPDIYLA